MVIKFSNGPVIWKSKIQKCVAMSSMEAEYVAASETGKSILWIDRLLKEIGAINYTSVPLHYM
ncbi:MAG: Ty1/Copia family ribonuclease HI [Janthinobacterium lividum]